MRLRTIIVTLAVLLAASAFERPLERVIVGVLGHSVILRL